MATLILLTACADASVDAAPLESAAPTSEATIEPAPAIAPRPDLVFGGDCGALFDEAAVAALTGAPVTPRSTRIEHDWAVETLGGLSCGWADEADLATLRITVLPIAALAAVTVPAEEEPWCYGGPESGGSEGRCTFDAMVDGYWLSGVLGVTADASGTAKDAIAQATARVADVAAGAPAQSPLRPDGAWSSVAGCAAVEPALASAVGGAYAAEVGNGPGETPAGLIAAFAAAGGTVCIWRDDAAGIIYSGGMLPGAGWAVEWLQTAGASSVTVEGAVAAVAVGGGRDGIEVDVAEAEATTVYATDGVNLAWVSSSLGADEDQAAAAVGAVLAAPTR